MKKSCQTFVGTFYKACDVLKSVSAGDGKKDKKDGDALVKMETDKK